METYQTNPTPAPTLKPQKTNKVGFKFMLATLLCIALLSFALLTKAAIIPNYFDIEILCSAKEDSPPLN